MLKLLSRSVISNPKLFSKPKACIENTDHFPLNFGMFFLQKIPYHYFQLYERIPSGYIQFIHKLFYICDTHLESKFQSK